MNSKISIVITHSEELFQEDRENVANWLRKKANGIRLTQKRICDDKFVSFTSLEKSFRYKYPCETKSKKMVRCFLGCSSCSFGCEVIEIVSYFI